MIMNHISVSNFFGAYQYADAHHVKVRHLPASHSDDEPGGPGLAGSRDRLGQGGEAGLWPVPLCCHVVNMTQPQLHDEQCRIMQCRLVPLKTHSSMSCNAITPCHRLCKLSCSATPNGSPSIIVSLPAKLLCSWLHTLVISTTSWMTNVWKIRRLQLLSVRR